MNLSSIDSSQKFPRPSRAAGTRNNEFNQKSANNYEYEKKLSAVAKSCPQLHQKPATLAGSRQRKSFNTLNY